MRCVVVSRRLVPLAAAALALAGCGSGGSTGSGMMGAGGRSTGYSAGPGMIGGGAGYRFAQTTCSAPGSLPGHIVNVTLADMGMSRMMGGTAPLGAHMTLRLSQATVLAGRIS